MSGIVAIRLHGPLADKYGGEHHFAIRSPREAIDALDCNYPGFRRDFLSHPMYGLIVDGDWRNEGNTPDVANSPVSREMDIAPMVEGRLQAAIVPILGIIGITGVAATVLASVISIGLLIGMSLLLTPKPKKKTTEDAPTSQDNYMFSGPENTVAQGVAVPLIYGRCFVGSVVVSAGFEVAEGIGSSGYNWSWSRATAFSVEDRAEPTLLDVAAARAFVAEAEEPPPPTPPPPGRTWPPYSPGNA